jgi:hypothetical protein
MEKKEDLDQFFPTKKVYVRMGLIVLGMIVVFFMIKKMKNEYVN